MSKKLPTKATAKKNALLLTVSALALVGALFMIVRLVYQPSGENKERMLHGEVLSEMTQQDFQELTHFSPDKVEELMQQLTQGAGIEELRQLFSEAQSRDSSDDLFTLFTNPAYHELQVQQSDAYSTQKQGQARDLQHLLPPEQVEAIDQQLGGVVSIFWRLPNYPVGVEVVLHESRTKGVPGQEIARIPAERLVYERTELENGEWYYYTLKSIGRKGEISEMTAEVAVRPTDALAPASPYNVRVTPQDDGTMSVRWNHMNLTDVAYHEIHRSTTPGQLGVRMTQVAAPTLAWHDTRTVVGENYYYTIVAVDSAGNKSANALIITGNPQPFLTQE